MKPFLACALLLLVFGIEACSTTRHTHSRTYAPPPPPPPPPVETTAAPAPAPPTPTVAPVVPTPAPVAPAPAEAWAGRTLDFHEGMERVSDADVEGSLERWADGKEIDLAHVIKRTGVFVDVAAKIKWDGNKKRSRDAADHDRIARESETKAQELLAAARAGSLDKIKPLSDQLLTLCVDCHTKYK